MRTFSFTLLLNYCLVFSSNLQAECTCLWEGSFVDVQAEADIVISGTVRNVKGNSVDLEINRALRGPVPELPIRVWLQTGDYCRPPVSNFPEDSEWVMALHAIKEVAPDGFNPLTPNVSYGRVGDYTLSNCGGYWLSRSGDWVSGNLINAPRWVREPKMTPVLLDLIEGYVQGNLDETALLKASREDPAVRKLMLDTRAFLRKEN